MEKKPILFTIDIDSFDLSLLPIDSELLKSDESLLKQAISEYFAEHFRKIGGSASIVVADNAVTVHWTPHSLNDTTKLKTEIVELLKQGAYETAEPLIKGLLSQFPDDPILLFNYGMVLSDQGKLKDAIEMLTKLVGLDPDSANGWNALGVAHSRAGNDSKAINALKKSLEISKGNGYAYKNLGALIGKSDPGEALPYLEKAAELLPEDQQAQYGLGFCLIQLGDFGKADGILKKAIDLDPYSQIAEFCRQERTKIADKGMRAGLAGVPRPDAVMYCLAALQKFAQVGPEKRQAIAFEIALLGRSGLDINNPDKKYQLKSMPGEFTGMQLVSYMYVGFKQIDPSLDSGIDLKNEYEMAMGMFEKEDGA